MNLPESKEDKRERLFPQVLKYYEEGKSIYFIEKMLKTDYRTINRWIAQYERSKQEPRIEVAYIQDISRKLNLHTQKQLKYFDEVMRLHYEKNYSAGAISKIIPVEEHTISRWISIFAEKFKELTMQKEQETQKYTNMSGAEVADKIAELEEKLRLAELKATAYDRMIDIAEAKFNIPIRKKVGTKQ